MRRLLRCLLPLLLVGWIRPGSAHAAFEDLGVGARVTGMGNAFASIADDVHAIYYNPAGLGTLERPQFTSSYSRLFLGLSDNSNLGTSFLAYTHPLGGRWGSLGTAWQYFNLGSLYREQSIYLSYGRLWWRDGWNGEWYGGLNLKYLNRSLGSTSVSSNALGVDGLTRTGNADPVLSNTSKSVLDGDLGLLYRTSERYSLALAVTHLMEPNVAFDSRDSDKLARAVKFGFGFKSLWMDLAAQFDFRRAPNGENDKIVTAAAERWFPTLLYGQFGFRGSLGIGSREFKQITVGTSYRVNKIQVDYGFMMPIGTIEGTAGTHRFGLTFHFGAPTVEEQYGDLLLEQMKKVAGLKVPEYHYEGERIAKKRRGAVESIIEEARRLIEQGEFEKALEQLGQALKRNPGDQELLAKFQRLNLVAGQIPVLQEFQQDKGRRLFYEGILDFLGNRDADAVKKISYSLSLDPSNKQMDELLNRLEKESGIRAERVQKGSPLNLVEQKLVEALISFKDEQYDRVVFLCQEVLDLEPGNLVALQRMGSALYVMKEYNKALEVWQKAYQSAGDESTKATLKKFMDGIQRILKGEEPAPPEPRRPARLRPSAPRAAPESSPRQIEQLFQNGVTLYANGDLRQAAKVFRRILELNPKNSAARRALERIQNELRQGEAR